MRDGHCWFPRGTEPAPNRLSSAWKPTVDISELAFMTSMDTRVIAREALLIKSFGPYACQPLEASRASQCGRESTGEDLYPEYSAAKLTLVRNRTIIFSQTFVDSDTIA
jgi:hypothetical protein